MWWAWGGRSVRVRVVVELQEEGGVLRVRCRMVWASESDQD